MVRAPSRVRGVGGRFRPVVAAVSLAPGERASWIRTTSASAATIRTIVGLCVVLAAATIATTIATVGQYWALSFIPLVVLLLLALSNFAGTVRMDARGVRVRGVLGIPVLRIPLDQVTSADVIAVKALPEYGGWASAGRSTDGSVSAFGRERRSRRTVERVSIS